MLFALFREETLERRKQEKLMKKKERDRDEG